MTKEQIKWGKSKTLVVFRTSVKFDNYNGPLKFTKISHCDTRNSNEKIIFDSKLEAKFVKIAWKKWVYQKLKS